MPEYNPNSIWKSRAEKPPISSRSQGVAPASPTTPASKPEPELTPAAGRRIIPPPEEAPRKSHAWLWALGVFVVLLGGGLAYIYLKPQPGPNVGISFAPPSQILEGDPFDLSINVANYSPNVLKNAVLDIQLPDSVSFVGQEPNTRIRDLSIGDLPTQSGDIIPPQTIHLIATGDPNSVKHVAVKLTYSTDEAGKTSYETDGGTDLIVGGPAVMLSFSGPSNIYSGQDFDLAVNYANNTNHSIQTAKLDMDYPPAYSFTKSDAPAANAVNNSWNLGTLGANATGTFTITGHIVGPDKATYSIEGTLKGNISGVTYPLTSQAASLGISAAPLSVSVVLNAESGYVAHAGDTLDYTITYANNSDTTFQNVVVKAALVGTMLDFSTLKSDGAFNSVANTVSWYTANTPALQSLAPGETGSLEVKVRLKSSFQIHDNDALVMNASIASPTVPAGTQASSTVSATTIRTPVGGVVALGARAYWHDPSGITNSGPYPPKVNQATRYTIHLTINNSTILQNVTLSGALQSGTTCTGVITMNLPTSSVSLPTCDSATGLISWSIPGLAAVKSGVPAAEAIIQVENTPAVNQIDQSVTLLGAVSLQATEQSTGQVLKASSDPVTTDLPYDKSIPITTSRLVTQ